MDDRVKDLAEKRCRNDAQLLSFKGHDHAPTLAPVYGMWFIQLRLNGEFIEIGYLLAVRAREEMAFFQSACTLVR